MKKLINNLLKTKDLEDYETANNACLTFFESATETQKEQIREAMRKKADLITAEARQTITKISKTIFFRPTLLYSYTIDIPLPPSKGDCTNGNPPLKGAGGMSMVGRFEIKGSLRKSVGLKKTISEFEYQSSI
jgi:hypothetical protein